MPRQARINFPGAIHHIMVRGIERRKIFRDNKDRQEFLDRLEKSLSKSNTHCHAWALLDNHVHLLIRTMGNPLSDLMKSLLTSYAIYFNAFHRRRGYLFQNRYKSVLCQEDEYYLQLVRYIHLNPLRSGIVDDYNKLSRYPWSGHSALVGKVKRDWQEQGEVLSHFGRVKKKAIKQYLEFVKDGIPLGRQEHLTGGGLRRSSGGWTAVLKLKQKKEFWRRDERILGDGTFVDQALKSAGEGIERREALRKDGWNLERLANRISELFSLEEGELKRRGRTNTLSIAKSVFCYWGSKELGLKGIDIAKYLEISQPAVSQNIQRGFHTVKENGYILLT